MAHQEANWISTIHSTVCLTCFRHQRHSFMMPEFNLHQIVLFLTLKFHILLMENNKVPGFLLHLLILRFYSYIYIYFTISYRNKCKYQNNETQIHCNELCYIPSTNVNCIFLLFFDQENLNADELKERKPIILFFQVFNTLLQLRVSEKKKKVFLEWGSTIDCPKYSGRSLVFPVQGVLYPHFL